MTASLPDQIHRQRADQSAALVFINPDGSQGEPIPEGVDTDLLRRAYRHMALIRALDKKAVALQRTGQMRTYPSSLGQEAIGTGIGLAMHSDDVFVPYYRDQATMALRGVTLAQILQVWGGDERGHLFGGDAARDLPICVPIATQMTHAAGVAVAIKSRGLHQAVVATCGDGATSRGDFYEALNLAGVWQLPMVAVINNNQWAISVPRHLQTGTVSLAQKAVAAGIHNLQVDGNDVAAVYHAVSEALQRARAGKGATLIEAISYRLSDHTTADDATRYRDAAEVRQAWEHEPVKRLQTWLHNQKAWTPEDEQELQRDVQQQVEQAVASYQATPPQDNDEFLRYQFEEMTGSLQEQQKMVKLRHPASKPRGGDAHE